MSQENVELAHRFYSAVNRRDVDAFLALADQEAELVSILVSVDGDFHGHAGFRRWWENVFGMFPDYTIEVGDIRDLGELTLAAIRLRGHGSGSGAPIDQNLSQVIEWRHENAVWVESFRTEEEALEAIGSRRRTARAMAPENVDALRAVYGEWGRGNFRAGVDLYDRHILLLPPETNPRAGRYLGPEGIREFMQEWLNSWTDFTITATEFIDAGDSVVVATEQRGVGRDSGAPTEGVAFMVWTFRGSSVTRIEYIRDRGEALKAVGLSE